ncbi:MAG TPA: heme ABC transporter permease [Terricaulis sp.]|nr:heme ABC transporter permease [Terricaulis sp.]
MLTYLSNPARFMGFSAWAAPLFLGAAFVLFAVGAPWGLFYSPADYQQGETVRIMYVHVPAAWWSLGVYAFMGVASFVGLVWRHALADVAARAAAPIGAVFAGLCLVTGSLWGAPTWGTWWEWDGRMTSMLVLFITYLGYIALWASIEDEEKAARLAAILCLAGLVNLPIVKFSVDWWSTLHQPASILRSGGSAIHPSMMGPLFTMAGAYLCLFAGLTLTNMRAAIQRRRVEAARQRAGAP